MKTEATSSKAPSTAVRKWWAVPNSAMGALRPDPRPWWSWAGIAGIGLLALVLFAWDLSRNGMANEYYAAAVKSASVSWKAWFFGSLDPGSFITVDKLPAALWLQGLSARLFGFSSWSMLLPQALAGVASVLIVYRLVRRWQGEVAGLLAALALALTPVAVVMFRFNNPDALLTLLLLAAAWALWSALEKGSTWKLVACGALVGFAFLTKMLEALVVLPAFAGVYLICGPTRLRRRLLQTAAAGASLVVAGGWYIATVALWPASSRPYIGGTGTNSVLDLVLSRTAGYSGSAGVGPGGGPGGGPSFAGTTGWLRIFNAELGGQISWLVPLALVGLVAGLWLTRRGRRTDLGRAGYLLWGGWTLLYLIVFSFARGVLHPYYAVVIAPAVAALAGAGSVAMWRLARQHRWLAWLLPAAVAGTAVLAAWLLGRTPDFAPGLGLAVLTLGGLGSLAFLVMLAFRRILRIRAAVFGAAALVLVCVLAGPAAYSLSTVSHSVTGALAAAGPQSATGFAGGFPGQRGPAFGQAEPGGSPAAGAPGPGSGGAVDAQLIAYLEENRGGAEYLVAVQGAQSAQPFILATGEPVIAMGGFGGFDPAPTLAELQRLAAEQKLRFLLLGSGGPGMPPFLAFRNGAPGGFPGGAGGPVSQYGDIAEWVRQNAIAIDAGAYGGTGNGGTLYQLW